ncbi:MAG: DUF3368 domain-containing protein [Clostridia bacterium]|nr:DUF3368 domain-containing protein [Clostridia bacterium]
MTCPLPYVTDTNIWIDLHHGRLVAQLFELHYKFVAPDVIIAELDEPPGHFLLSLGLQQCSLSGEQVAQVESLAKKYRGPSPKDLFALVLAKDLKAILLTGDRLLCKAAEAEGVTVHGTLWILDMLITRRIILPREAAAALRKMLSSGSRLPEQECQARLKRWERSKGG